MKVLVTAASKHGSTWEIAQAIGDTIAAAKDVHADVLPINDVKDVSGYDGIILGSAVYAGHWLKTAHTFVDEHAAEMAGHPVWLFSSGPLGPPLKPAKGRVVDISHIAEQIRIKEHRILAGRLENRHLGILERTIKTLVGAPQGDFRDWKEIRTWAAGIAQTLKRVRTVHKGNKAALQPGSEHAPLIGSADYRLPL